MQGFWCVTTEYENIRIIYTLHKVLPFFMIFVVFIDGQLK